ncbi:MAG: YitT family protein, partial [Clostridia bacterium]|nr:YitT family protein [Clostridia bacterium]
MKPYDKPQKRIAITTLSIVGGNLLLAFLVAAFIIPHDILMGGTSGIGIVLSKLFPWLDVSLVILVLNVILLVIGRIVLGRTFAATTVASSILYPLFLAVFQRIPG